jgi:hypothetical protein
MNRPGLGTNGMIKSAAVETKPQAGVQEHQRTPLGHAAGVCSAVQLGHSGHYTAVL